MGSLRLVTIVLLLGSPAFAQSPTYGVGRTPTAEEIRALDISIGPTGEELPPGRGTAKEGAEVFEQKGCVVCHGEAGIGGPAPALKSKKGQDVPIWERERILPLRAPFATTVWDFIHRGMPLGSEGTLTADEVSGSRHPHAGTRTVTNCECVSYTTDVTQIAATCVYASGRNRDPTSALPVVCEGPNRFVL